jgi:LRR receptor-like serine/threonine-protein kinase ERECTA
LWIFDLAQNKVTGTIPATIESLQYFSRLDLPFNQLNGCIPSSLGSLSILSEIDLSFSQLTESHPNISKLLSADLKNMISQMKIISRIHHYNIQYAFESEM